MKNYGNRRRPHVHLIKQYSADTLVYQGTRIIISRKHHPKKIYDIGNFQVHIYENPKKKKNTVSKWEITHCSIPDVIQKEMTNYSIDGRFKMLHVLYESPVSPIEDFVEEILRKEQIEIPLAEL